MMCGVSQDNHLIHHMRVDVGHPCFMPDVSACSGKYGFHKSDSLEMGKKEKSCFAFRGIG